MHNHHLLQVSERPQWLTIKQGAKLYIDAVIKNVDPSRIYLNTPVTKVIRRNGKVIVTSNRGEETFDHVIFASHADTTLKLLSDASNLEREILQNFEFTKNVATLHSDLTVFPH